MITGSGVDAAKIRNSLCHSGLLTKGVSRVADIREITRFGVMTTPALVVDGKVSSVGKVLAREDVKKFLRA